MKIKPTQESPIFGKYEKIFFWIIFCLISFSLIYMGLGTPKELRGGVYTRLQEYILKFEKQERMIEEQKGMIEECQDRLSIIEKGLFPHLKKVHVYGRE